MTPHGYLISITPLSEGSDYKSVMRAVIGLPLSYGSDAEVASPPRGKYSLYTALPVSAVFDVCEDDSENLTKGSFSPPRRVNSIYLTIYLNVFHMMYLFLMNTQVGSKIQQEPNKRYLS